MSLEKTEMNVQDIYEELPEGNDTSSCGVWQYELALHT